MSNARPIFGRFAGLTRQPAPSGATAPAPGAPPGRQVPPLLLPGALGFWGWHSGLWWVAVPLLVLAELPRVIRWRFALAPRERQRVADLCTLLIALVGVWFALREPRLGAALIDLIRWLPVLVFPLLAVQLYDERHGLELSVLFLSLRGAGKPTGEAVLDLRWGYLVLCVIAGAMVTPDSPWFPASLALLAAYVLWPFGVGGAGRRVALLVVATVLGLALAAGLRYAHEAVELQVERWLEAWFGLGEDPFRATTALGDVGRVKDSDSLRLRLYPAPGRPDPAAGAWLLRTATYDRFVDNTWFTSSEPFAPLGRDGDGYALGPAPASGPETRLLLELQRPQGLLPLPADTARFQAPSLVGVERSGLGAVRFVHRGPPRLNLRVWHGPLAPVVPPTAMDLRVPPSEQAAVARFSAGAGLAGLDPQLALARLERLFATDFRYTLDLPAVPTGATAVGDFLLESRAGHCEYFATAAVLVLRQLGLPARYARGWSVQEWSALEGAWIARDRHAHAWAQVWVDGAWRDFDPTPPDWDALEATWRPGHGLADRIAWLRFVLSGGTGEQAGGRDWLLWPLGLLVGVLGWRIARRGRRRAAARRDAAATAAPAPHPFQNLEQALARRGLGRRTGETLWDWAQRLRGLGEPVAGPLRVALALYYRGRFDPAGLTPTQQAALTTALAGLAGTPGQPPVGPGSRARASEESREGTQE